VRLISPLLKRVVYPSLAKTGYLRRSAGPGPAVVTYHGVLPAGYRIIDPDLDGSLVSAEDFRWQLQLLKDRYHVISPEEFLRWCESKQGLPLRSVLLTCDDGLRNALTDMLPILQELGLSCLFFVTGAFLRDTPSMLWYEELYLMILAAPQRFTLDLPEIGVNMRVTGQREKRALWWSLIITFSRYESGPRRTLLEQVRTALGIGKDWTTEYLEDPARGCRFLVLSAPELRRLAAAGMCVGAHTLSHPMLSRVSTELAWNEISGGRHSLERALGRPVWALAYPFGDAVSITPREPEMAERAGYTCAFTNFGGGFGAYTPRFALPRVHVTLGMSLAEFEAHLSGFYRSLRRRFMRQDETRLAIPARGAVA
jgi:peptidoglycan/xylan/chitin deacetylase (PgdA/CDA1 family)